MNVEQFIHDGKPEYLMQAILDIRQQMIDDPKPGEPKPHSDKWVFNLSHDRPILVGRIKMKWGDITDRRHFECPFTDDAIVELWVLSRKNTTTMEIVRKHVREAKKRSR